MNIVFSTIGTLLVLTFFIYLLSNPKNEKSTNLIVKFPKGLINGAKIATIVFAIIVLLLVGIIIYGSINPEWMIAEDGSDTTANIIAISIIMLIFFLLTTFSYLFLKNKVITLHNSDITYKSLFKKDIVFKINDIKSVEDIQNNKIELILKSKEKVSIDYQMENFQIFKDTLKSHGIEVPGKELW